MTSETPPPKHELSCPWTFWSLNPERFGDSSESTLDVSESTEDFSSADPSRLPRFGREFTSFEDFWAIYNAVTPPSTFCGYGAHFIFKSGIRPTWDDHQNYGGTEIYAEYQNSCEDDGSAREIEIQWMNVLLSTFGKSFPLSDKVNGIIIDCQNQKTKISVWIISCEPPTKKSLISSITDLFKSGTKIRTRSLNSAKGT